MTSNFFFVRFSIILTHMAYIHEHDDKKKAKTTIYIRYMSAVG